MRVAVYPGSFDPITNGHLDIIERATKLFDKVIVLVAVNPNKKSRFSVEDRLNMIKESVKNIPNVEVDSYSGVTLEYAKNHDAIALIRGLRVVSDFEYEWSYAAENEFINKDIEMVFLMARKHTSFISSSSIDEMYKAGIDISPLVPKAVIDYYKSK